MTLERTGCMGVCPVYELTIRGDGTVVYEGSHFVKEEGIRTAKISRTKINNLVAKFLKMDYFALEDRYHNDMVSCLPSAITSIAIDGRKKRIDHYEGAWDVPDQLTALEKAIDRSVNSRQWVGRPENWLPPKPQDRPPNPPVKPDPALMQPLEKAAHKPIERK